MQKKAISFIAIIFLSSLAQAKIDLSLSDEKANLGEEIFLKISNEHFFLNKDLAMINVEIFHSLIAQLDSQKIYFTKYEINSFSKKFKDFDNVDRVNKKNRTETKKLNLEATYLLINLYFNRLIEATNFNLLR
jgi:hypothetical protein